MNVRRPGATLLLLALSACQATESPGREQVAQEISERLGVEPGWDPEAASALEREALEDGVIEGGEALRLALGRNALLRARLADLDLAYADVLGAGLLPNPQLDAELRFLEGGGGEILELSLVQSMVGLLLMPRREQVARTRLEAARWEAVAAVLDLAAETSTAYRRYQGQLMLVGVLEHATQATFLGYDAARRLREAGNVRQLDVVAQRALYEETKVDLARARAEALVLREDLNLLMALYGPVGDSWVPEPRLPDPTDLDIDPAELEARAVEASLDLDAGRGELVALGQSLGLRRMEARFGEGSIGASGEREADGGWSVGPAFSVSLPFFDHGQAAGLRARARMQRAYDRFTYLAARVRGAARSAHVEAASLGASARFYREVVLPARAEATQQTQLQFNAMQVGVLQLLEEKQRELAATRRYVEALRDHWVARVRLEAILLGRLPQERFGMNAVAERDQGPDGRDRGAGDTGGGH